MPAETDTHADIVIADRNCGRIRAGWYPYTFPFTLTGHPALSMPCGWTPEGQSAEVWWRGKKKGPTDKRRALVVDRGDRI
ncbi:MAG: hypothetical protein ACTSQ7_09475 [Alphaproteobacteria bacterium]